MLQHEEVLLLYDEKKSQKRDEEFSTSNSSEVNCSIVTSTMFSTSAL